MWSDERWKIARRCGAKHISNSKCTKHISFGTFLKLGCRKSAFRCGTKHISKSKCTKHSSLGAFWKLRCSKSVRRCGAKQHVEVKSAENRGARSTFGRSDVVSRGRRKGLRTLSKVSKAWGLCSSFKNDGRRGTCAEDPVRGAVQETCSSELLGGQSVDFLREVAYWSIRSWGLLRWFCVTGAALRMTWHHFFVAGAVL